MVAMLLATNACLFGIPRATAQEAEAPRDISAGVRQLFLDDWLVADATNIERVQGIPTKHPGNPVIRRDKPWDQGRADLYGSAAVIGFTPQEVNEISMWQFLAVAEGWATAHEHPEPGSISNKEQDDIWEWMQTKH